MRSTVLDLFDATAEELHRASALPAASYTAIIMRIADETILVRATTIGSHNLMEFSKDIMCLAVTITCRGYTPMKRDLSDDAFLSFALMAMKESLYKIRVGSLEEVPPLTSEYIKRITAEKELTQP